ncbi:hypothetical protein SERLA73DRAFT_164031 [Serpula lacrymans var. lacrymans S7.3]|uniref:Heterokaryon incompatibility domain-containing protein n=1 Tax=Serpula lacrymans var. lacrymans (strain S7.3) TaxID=936435 RepID=F8QGS0_SERL3|nr:hypothetical protein SERLA73DRAFT_164031 [Serpula lacrymans var. lacrymans S7.3]
MSEKIFTKPSITYVAKDRSVILWADAICINQDDLDERRDQVSQMQYIYKGAQEVLIWLGEGSDLSDTALNFVLELPHLLEDAKIAGEGKKVLNDPMLRDRWMALGWLMMRPWWRRVWVTQEVAFARCARILCGLRSIPWSAMEGLLAELKHSWQWALHTDADPDVATIIRLASTSRSVFEVVTNPIAQGQPVDLSSLLKITHFFKATDPRDKIFALLGMTDKETQECVQPNNFFSWTLNNPDPRLGDAVHSRPNKVYAAGEAELAGLVANIRFNESDEMIVDGVELDSIAQMDLMMLFDLDEYSKQGDRVPTPKIVEKPKAEAVMGSAEPYIAGGSQRSAFYRSILLDCRVPYLDAESATPKRLLESRTEPVHILPKSAEEVDALLHNMSESLRLLNGRCFFTTTAGYMRIGPRTARCGDKVCVLLGSELPFVLREIESKCFRMIGECYLHGIMDGEIMEEVRMGQRELQSMNIR